jgi:hypothetical protein
MMAQRTRLGTGRPHTRTRKPPDRSHPFVTTDTAEFDSHLILNPKEASASATPPLTNMSEEGDRDSESPHAASQDADQSGRPIIDIDADNDGEHLDAQLAGDDEAHQKKKPRPTTRKRKAAAAAAAASSAQEEKDDNESKKKKLAKWTHEEDMALLQAILAFVNANRGQLPPMIRTTASARAPKPWITIKKAVSKVSGMNDNEAAKACSNRWTAIRAGTKVSQTDKQTEVANARCMLMLSTVLVL